MNIKKLLLISLAGSILSACGGSDYDSDPDPTIPEPAAITKTGKVADGYLVGATVCLDLNLNKICDPDEPSTTSTAGGDFTISGATQEQIDSFPLLVEVTVGVVDEDTGEAITQPYTMSAPVGYEFVSPLTTMVQNEVEQGSELSEAEASLQSLLGTDLDLTQDYVAQQLNDELGSDEQEEYERLHHIAQVTAQIIASNLAAIQDAADTAGISLDDVVGLIVDQIIDALEVIVNEVEFVENQGGEFDPDDVLDSEVVTDASTVPTENLEDQVAIRDAEASAAAANLTELVSSDGINIFEGGFHGDMIELSYATILYDSDTQTTTETRFKLVEGVFVTDDFSRDNEDLILTEQGWVMGSDNFAIGDLNDDGSITLVNNDLPILSETLTAEQLSVSGLNIKLFLEENNGELWHKVLPEEVTFSEDAEAFKLSFSNTNDIYAIFNWNDCDPEHMVEGMCNSVWAHTAGSEMDGPAITLDSLVSAIASDGMVENIVGPHVAWDGNRSVIAEMLVDGTANFYKIEWQAQSDSGEVVNIASLIATSSWLEATVHEERLFLLTMPEVIQDFGDNDDQDDVLLLVEYQGAVRRGEFAEAGQEFDDDEWVYNLIAKTDILENLDLTLLNNITPPEPDHSDFVCRDGDSDWDEVNDRPKEGTTRSFAEYLALVANCRDGEALSFATDVIANHRLKNYDSDGNIETIFVFNADGTGSITEYDVEPFMVEDFHWDVNASGELIIEMGNSAGTNDVRAVISLIRQDGDHYSIKGFVEDIAWSPMDGTVGEVWSEKLTLFPLDQQDNSASVCTQGDSDWNDETEQPVLDTLRSMAEYEEFVAACGEGEALSFVADVLADHRLKSFDENGAIETTLAFNANGTGLLTDHEGEQDAMEEFDWLVNADGQIIIEIANSQGTNDLRVVISLIMQDGDHFSVKGFTEDIEWSPMDGTAGEVWSGKLQLFTL